MNDEMILQLFQKVPNLQQLTVTMFALQNGWFVDGPFLRWAEMKTLVIRCI